MLWVICMTIVVVVGVAVGVVFPRFPIRPGGVARVIEFVPQHDLFHALGKSHGQWQEPVPRDGGSRAAKHFVEFRRDAREFRSRRTHALLHARNLALSRSNGLELFASHGDGKGQEQDTGRGECQDEGIPDKGLTLFGEQDGGKTGLAKVVERGC